MTVWDFEQPDEVMVPFLAALLGIDTELLDSRTRSEISKNACQQLKNAKRLSKIVQLDEDLQTRMDVQYELDLAAIEAMPRVILN